MTRFVSATKFDFFVGSEVQSVLALVSFTPLKQPECRQCLSDALSEMLQLPVIACLVFLRGACHPGCLTRLRVHVYDLVSCKGDTELV